MTSTTIHEHTFRSMDSKPDWVPRALHDKSVRIYYCRFNVRKEDAGFILGTRGFKINRFKRDTGANIRLVHTEYEMPHFLIESMSHDSVRSALHSIGVEANKAFDLNTGRKQKTRPQKHYQLTVPVVPATAGLLIGKGGATCRGIKHKLRLAGLRVDTQDGTATVRISGDNHEHCQRALAQLQIDFPTVFFTAPPAPRKQQPPRPTTPPSRPPPPVFNAEAEGIPRSPIENYLPGGGARASTPPQQHAPGSSSYYPARNPMEAAVMSLYPTMFDGLKRETPQSPHYEPHTPPGTPPPV